MIVLILLAFVGMLTGIFLILGMTPFTFAEELTKPFLGGNSRFPSESSRSITPKSRRASVKPCWKHGRC